MLQLMVFVLLCTIINNGISAYTVQKKCSLNDNECQLEFFTKAMETATNTGIPEFGIPVLDPFAVHNREVAVMGLLKVKAIEGTVEGIKTCSVKSNSINWDTKTTYVEYACEVVKIQGKYKLETTDALKQLVGDLKIHGEGVASLKIENVQLTLQIPFEINKLKDGELHGAIDPKKITYTYEVLGKATLGADNLFVGEQDISTVAVNIFNENWKILSKLVGRPVLDLALEVFAENANRFFAAVPFKEILSEDVSKYA